MKTVFWLCGNVLLCSCDQVVMETAIAPHYDTPLPVDASAAPSEGPVTYDGEWEPVTDLAAPALYVGSNASTPFRGVVARPRQLLAGLACQNTHDKWAMLTYVTNDLATCALTTDDNVACYSAALELQTATPGPGWAYLGSGVLGSVVDLAIADNWVGVLNADNDLHFWKVGTIGTAEVGFSPLGQYLQIAGGGMDHDFCAIDADGHLHIWELSADGPPEPMVSPPGTYQQISLSTYSPLCALDTDGKVFCWGEPGQRDALPQMFDAPPDGPFESLSVSDCGACAVDESGELFCWSGVEEWTEWGGLNGLLVDEVDVGGCSICARPDEGPVQCWSNEEGAHRATACALGPLLP
jgi:hypothetical protein